MAESGILVHRLVESLSEAPSGADAQLDIVSRKVAQHVATGISSYAHGSSPSPPGIRPQDIVNLLASEFPQAEVVSNGVWVWVIDPETGHRYLLCTDAEVVLSKQKVGTNIVTIDPPIGVQFQAVMGELEYDD